MREWWLLESIGPDNLNWQAIRNTYGQASDPRDTFLQAGYLATSPPLIS